MRKVRTALMLMVMALIAGSAIGAEQSSKPLTNEDVVSMAKSLLPESVIVSAIKTNDTDFDVSAGGLIALKKAGVTAKVMEAMLDAANKKKTGTNPPVQAASPVPNAALDAGAFAPGSIMTSNAMPVAAAAHMGAATPWQPAVEVLQGNTRVNLTAESTQIVQTKTKPTSLTALAADEILNQALQVGTQMAQQALMKSSSSLALASVNPGAAILKGFLGHRPKQTKVTYVWALNGGSSAMNAAPNLPAFEVNYAGLPGVDADQFEPVIVKLSSTKSNFRLVGATEAATNVEQSAQQDWPLYSSFVEDRVASKVQKLGTGHAQITPAAAISPGEYAIALRPTDKAHKFSGEAVGKNQGEGLLFNYAWAFSVK